MSSNIRSWPVWFIPFFVSLGMAFGALIGPSSLSNAMIKEGAAGDIAGCRWSTHGCDMHRGGIRHGHVYDHCGKSTSSQRAEPHNSSISLEYRGRGHHRCPGGVRPRHEHRDSLAPSHRWADTDRMVLWYRKAVTGG